ncbi:MAG: efflux RND transporter periplasmic adaptor subunit [Flavobacteriales bacterium]|jgi:multidrug efflux pump subunit AcrA (membrane-fusion protein)|nr:efflux RND transporter periplasmic adaptor subunit [Flavobacteriales bacterium]
MKIRHILIIVTALFIFILLGAMFFMGQNSGMNYAIENYDELMAERKKGKTTANDSVVPKYVNVIRVKNEIHPVKLTGYGKVNAATSINISTEVQGQLNASISLKKGTKFRKGQTLFTIKNTDAKLALQSKKSGFLTQLTTILPDLNIDYPESYNNWKIFFEKINVLQPLPPLPDFKSSKEKSFIISRNILSQYYSIKSDEERLKKYIITAPFSGSIIESFSDQGATVSPGMAIIKILREGKLEIEIPVLSKNLPLVKLGQEVQLKSNQNNLIVGKVTRIGDYVNAMTQTFPVFVAIQNSDNDLYNGMYLEAKINCNSEQVATRIPRTAIFDEDYIFLVDQKGTLKKQKVTISTSQDKTVLVTNLKDGTAIVSEAIVNAKEGTKVSILNHQ